MHPTAQSCLTLGNPMDCWAPLPMEFSRQDYWSGLPFPSPGDLLFRWKKIIPDTFCSDSLHPCHLVFKIKILDSSAHSWIIIIVV